MADKDKKGMSFFNTLLAFAIIGGLLVWLAMVMSTKGENRLEQACKPIEYSTQFLHEMTTALIGRQPTWTLYVQRYLMTGCYYTFSIVMAQKIPGDDSNDSLLIEERDLTFGGIQQ